MCQAFRLHSPHSSSVIQGRGGGGGVTSLLQFQGQAESGDVGILFPIAQGPLLLCLLGTNVRAENKPGMGPCASQRARE